MDFNSLLGLMSPVQGDPLAMLSALSENPEALIPAFVQAGISPADFEKRFSAIQSLPMDNPLMANPLAMQDRMVAQSGVPVLQQPGVQAINQASPLPTPRAPLSYAEPDVPAPATNPMPEIPPVLTRYGGGGTMDQGPTLEMRDTPPARTAGASELAKILAGLKAPAAPEVPRLASHAPPAPRAISPQTPISALLAAALGRQQVPRLGAALGGR